MSRIDTEISLAELTLDLAWELSPDGITPQQVDRLAPIVLSRLGEAWAEYQRGGRVARAEEWVAHKRGSKIALYASVWGFEGQSDFVYEIDL